MAPGRTPVAASAASSTATETKPRTSSWVDEAGLEVELGELELAVGAQVLVAHAASDLVVAVEPADHEELLGDLRALRQHVELARVQARGNDELARALGRRGPEQRRLHLAETLRVHRRRIAALTLRAAAGCAAWRPGGGRGSGTAGAPARRCRRGRRAGTAARSASARTSTSQSLSSTAPVDEFDR